MLLRAFCASITLVLASQLAFAVGEREVSKSLPGHGNSSNEKSAAPLEDPDSQALQAKIDELRVQQASLQKQWETLGFAAMERMEKSLRLDSIQYDHFGDSAAAERADRAILELVREKERLGFEAHKKQIEQVAVEIKAQEQILRTVQAASEKFLNKTIAVLTKAEKLARSDVLIENDAQLRKLFEALSAELASARENQEYVRARKTGWVSAVMREEETNWLLIRAYTEFLAHRNEIKARVMNVWDRISIAGQAGNPIALEMVKLDPEAQRDIALDLANEFANTPAMSLKDSVKELEKLDSEISEYFTKRSKEAATDAAPRRIQAAIRKSFLISLQLPTEKASFGFLTAYWKRRANQSLGFSAERCEALLGSKVAASRGASFGMIYPPVP